MTKFCNGCGKTKNISDFYQTKDKPTPRCKSCFKEYYNKNKVDRLEYAKLYATGNREKLSVYRKQYRQSHKDQQRRYYREYKKNRYHKDLDFKIRCLLRSRVVNSLRFGRNGSAMKDLGCSLQTLRHHLESKFQPGMSWNNHGEWHIDHVKPLASFDLSDRGDFLKAVHYTNLQPLWAKDNLIKKDNI